VSQFPVIAIIDDDHAIREALEDLLSSQGYRALRFGRGVPGISWPGRG
jgi:FixJ family two-component response regulator